MVKLKLLRTRDVRYYNYIHKIIPDRCQQSKDQKENPCRSIYNLYKHIHNSVFQTVRRDLQRVAKRWPVGHDRIPSNKNAIFFVVVRVSKNFEKHWLI